MFKFLKRWFGKRTRNLDYQLKHGLAQRGRTVPAGGGYGGGKVGFAGKIYTKLTAKHLRKNADGEYEEVGHREVLNKKVTDDFVDFIVAQLQVETSTFGDFKWHDTG